MTTVARAWEFLSERDPHGDVGTRLRKNLDELAAAEEKVKEARRIVYEALQDLESAEEALGYARIHFVAAQRHATEFVDEQLAVPAGEQ